MERKELGKRYGVFFLGLLFVSLGICLATKSALGTSPISSIPYSLSLILPTLSLGKWTILFNLLLIAAQVVLLGRGAKRGELLLQVVMLLIFGYVIDFFMFCFAWYAPGAYGLRLLTLLAGCCSLAMGAYLQVVANVVMLPGDAFTRAVAQVTGKEFGQVRVISDVTMAAIACVLCLVCLHALVGVREGTVIAALLTGNLVKLYTRKLRGLTSRFFPEPKTARAR